MKYYNLLDMLLNDSNWAADWNQDLLILGDLLRTFKFTIAVQGDHTTPSTLTIQLQDATGTKNILEQFIVRVRVANAGGYANATHATIAAGAGSSVLETITATKDLVMQSNSSGLLTITCTDTTIETFQILIGSYVLSPKFADYNNSQAIGHA